MLKYTNTYAGEGVYEVCDVRVQPNFKLCQVCSDAHSRPIRHGGATCPVAPNKPQAKKDFLAKAKMPAPLPAGEVQLNEEMKKHQKKNPADNPFQCNFPGCHARYKYCTKIDR